MELGAPKDHIITRWRPGCSRAKGNFGCSNALDCVSSKRRSSTGLHGTVHHGQCSASEWTRLPWRWQLRGRCCLLSKFFWPLAYYISGCVYNTVTVLWQLCCLLVPCIIGGDRSRWNLSLYLRRRFPKKGAVNKLPACVCLSVCLNVCFFLCHSFCLFL